MAKSVNHNPKPALVKGGPQTEEGKQASSRNSTRHGLYARTLDAFAPADRAGFEALFLEYSADFKPKDLVERELVHQLAFNRFRYHRFIRFQEAAFSCLTDDRQALGEIDTHIKTHDYFERVLTHLDRAFHRTLRLLEDRRKHPPEPENKVIDLGVDLATRSIDYTSCPDLERLLENAETNSPQAHDYLRIRAIRPKGPRGWLEDCLAA